MSLLDLNNLILEAFESKYQADVIFTDFEKDFDRVDHKISIKILNMSGFDNPLLSWLESF